jgi:hypothetical protein
MGLWSLEGNNQKNYLATSPGGSAIGFGASLIVVNHLLSILKLTSKYRLLV